MACPHYYQLADGRELTEYLQNEISKVLEKHVSTYTAHCIFSALEHRFRCGKKEGESETDKEAEEWWLNQARVINSNATISMNLLHSLVQVCKCMIDIERAKAQLDFADKQRQYWAERYDQWLEKQGENASEPD